MISFHLDRVTHSYDGHTVLADVTADIAGGEAVSVIGHNGAGKSTLLRLLALLERPVSGAVKVRENGRVSSPDLALRRRIVAVLQRPILFNTAVIANVTYGLRLRGLSKQEAKQKARIALEAVDIAGLAMRRARSLSGGEAQLVNLARALALDPEALLLDEVTSHLDPDNEARVEAIIRQLHARGDKTIVLVTQDREQAERLTDRALVLRLGTVEDHIAFGGRPG
jgi:tungstate transport system ATP-binding protein